MAGSPHQAGPTTEAGAEQEQMSRWLVGPYRVLAGGRDLPLLVLGRSTSTLGDWLYDATITAAVYLLSHSATAVAALTFVRLLPFAALLSFSGSLVDRWDRRRLMVGATLGRVACMLGLSLAYTRGAVPLAALCVVGAAGLAGLARPAINAVLPGLAAADDMVAANSIISQMDSVAYIVGPTLGGILILLGQVTVAFLATGLCYLLAAAALFAVRVPARTVEERVVDEGVAEQMAAGFRFLFRENEGVLAALTISVATLTIVGGAFWTYAVVLCPRDFRLGAQGVGFLNSAYGAGCLVGGVIVSAVMRRSDTTRLFISASAVSGLVVAGFGLSPAGPLPFMFMAINGVSDVFSQVAGTTVLQRATPSELLGRVFGAFEAALIIAMLIGSIISGPLVDHLGARYTAVAFSILAVGVLLLCVPRLLRLEAALGVRIFLRQVPVLTNLSRRMLDDLGPRLHLTQFPAETTIVREGEQGDRLYIVKDGELEVVAQGDRPQPVTVARLARMDYFGEIALLRDVPRTATVRSRGPVELYSLSRADFQELLGRSTELHTAMSGTGDARYIDTQNQLLTRM